MHGGHISYLYRQYFWLLLVFFVAREKNVRHLKGQHKPQQEWSAAPTGATVVVFHDTLPYKSTSQTCMYS